jgi:hypothetical protein
MPEPLTRTGSCSRFCGRCCSLAAFQGNPQVSVVFPALKADGSGECSELIWENGMAKCRIYETRPDLCRIFPQVPVGIATVPECGYRFIQVEQREEVSHAPVSA